MPAMILVGSWRMMFTGLPLRMKTSAEFQLQPLWSGSGSLKSIIVNSQAVLSGYCASSSFSIRMSSPALTSALDIRSRARSQSDTCCCVLGRLFFPLNRGSSLSILRSSRASGSAMTMRAMMLSTYGSPFARLIISRIILLRSCGVKVSNERSSSSFVPSIASRITAALSTLNPLRQSS